MMSLSLGQGRSGPLQVLCLGCHADDLEIGCGGTLLRLAAEHPDCVFHWVVFSAIGERAEEARQAVNGLLDPSRLGIVRFATFPDGFMPFVGSDIKHTFEELRRSIQPDLIFSHNRQDAHQDHRLVADFTWNTFRDHLILEYEIPKYDGDMGQPNVFVPLSAEMCETKVELLTRVFRSQATKRWFRSETFLALMRLRGMECNAASNYAEAFYARKLVL
jgi:LmbE family N-acetylglucosaminyl deacetylase